MWRNLLPRRTWVGLLGVLVFVVVTSAMVALLGALIAVRVLRWLVAS